MPSAGKSVPGWQEAGNLRTKFADDGLEHGQAGHQWPEPLIPCFFDVRQHRGS